MHRHLLAATLRLTLAGSLAASAMFAQQPGSPQDPQQPPAPITRPYGHAHHHNPRREARMLSQKLGLTPDQTARLEPILADRDQKMAALRDNTSLTPEDRRQQMRSIGHEEHAQLAGVLTPEQQQQLKIMHREHRHQGEPASQPTGL